MEVFGGMKTYKFIHWVMCGLCLFSVQEADAKSPKPKTLIVTPIEQLCHNWGDLAREIAIGRDKNVSLVLTLNAVRSQLKTNDTETHRLATQLVYAVYATKDSPARVQRDFEVGCVLGDSRANTRY